MLRVSLRSVRGCRGVGPAVNERDIPGDGKEDSMMQQIAGMGGAKRDEGSKTRKARSPTIWKAVAATAGGGGNVETFGAATVQVQVDDTKER